ncbi:MAG: PEGA domain-containing protein [Candidatus Saccharibacteria bacterium]|nr:PEGA domain-containing protein [Candidatus Saccharibacteria bacterium]
MHQTTSTKKELARRTLVYALMTLTVISLLLLLLSYMFGYKLNPRTLTIEQQALVQYDSFPRGAMVGIDGSDFYATATKGIIAPGQHQFSMKLDGYETWQKTLDIKAGTVTHLVYARLVPRQLVTKQVATFPVMQSVKFAPGGRFMVGTGVVNGSPAVYWADIRSASEAKLTKAPLRFDAHGADQATTKLVIHEWDASGRYVLAQRHYRSQDTDMVQWLRLDRDHPGEMVDLSALAGVDIKDMHYIGTSGDELYLLQANGSIRQLSVSGASLSRPLLADVETFVLYGNDTISYTGRDAINTVAGVWRKGWAKPRIIRQVPNSAAAAAPLLIRASRYFNKDTLVVAQGDAAMVYRGSLQDTDEAMQELLQSGKRVALGRTITAISPNSDGRMIILRDTAGFVSYDIERSSISPQIAVAKELYWLDDFHVWHRDDAGRMVMQEFDGANRHTLMSVSGEYDATLAPDGKFIYGVIAAGGQLRLMQLAMTAAR